MNTVRIDDETMLHASMWCLRLAEGRLQADEDERLRIWLAADHLNALAFEQATETWRIFDLHEDDSDLMTLRRGALAHYGRSQNSQWRANARKRRWFASVAAAACIVVAAGAMLWSHFSPDRYETGLGERKVVALQDGSRVTLDADSMVETLYRDDRRELWLRQGRATFQVAHDPARPFSVELADKVVVATGTEFSVELVAEEVRVVLFQGQVDVLATSNNAVRSPFSFGGEVVRKPLAKLLPGTELVSAVGSAQITTRVIDPVRARTWESGLLTFNDESLGAAVERVNRQALPRIQIEDPSIVGMRVSGTFAAGDNRAFVEGITGVFPVRAIARNDYIAFVAAP